LEVELVFVDSTAFEVLPSLMVATRTDATPRISFRAFLMSDMSALSSSVIIICVISEVY
jgi:hypothetical protein